MPKKKAKRDVEKAYPKHLFIAKLRRLADALESGKTFRLQVAGVRVAVPQNAVINIEHECEDGAEETEFQMKWES